MSRPAVTEARPTGAQGTGARITTVLGDIDPADLGVTTMHEHVLTHFAKFEQMARDLPPLPKPRTRLCMENVDFLRGNMLYCPQMWDVEDVDYVAREVELFAREGGGAILDGSAMDIRGDIEGIAEISRRTGVHIVAATGLYRPSSMADEFAAHSSQELYEMCMREVREGIADTCVRAGAVKGAIDAVDSQGNLAEEDLRCLDVAARVAAETGLLLSVHSSYPTVPPRTVVATCRMLIDRYGIEPGKIYMCHNDSYALHLPGAGSPTMFSAYATDPARSRNVSVEVPLALLDMGVTIGLDSWGMTASQLPFVFPDDNDRVKMAYQLVERGYAGQIVFGHDCVGALSGVQHGGHGMTRFLAYGIPRLRELGVSQTDIDQITVRNPARMLSHE